MKPIYHCFFEQSGTFKNELEFWEDVKGYEGLYKVSNLGRIKAINKYYRHTEKNLKQITRKDGYKQIGLFKNGIGKNFYVHKLVAEAFLDKNNFKYMPDENRVQIDLKKLQVNHKDENKTNNCIENLEWCTIKYNNNYGTLIERQRKAKNRVKGVIQLKLDGSYINKFYSISEASRETGVTRTSIGECCRGERKQTGGYKWKYDTPTIC